MVKVANNYEPTIYNHIFLMAVIRNSANSGSNDRFGINEYLLWTYGRFVVDLHRRNENASFYVRQVDADEAFVGLFKKSHIFLLEESD